MSSLVFIDTPEAMSAARVAGERLIVTDNPLLAADPACEGVENVEARIDQATANRLGLAAIRISEAVDDCLRAGQSAALIGIPADHLQLAGALCRLLAAILYRAAAFALRLRDADVDSIVLRVTETAGLNSNRPLVIPRLFCPHVALAAEGFFAPRTVELAYIGQAGVAKNTGEIPRNFIRRFIHRPVSEWLHAALERSRLDWLYCNGPVLAVTKTNETLGETLPWLAARRYRLKHIDKLLDSIQVPKSAKNDERFAEIAKRAVASAFEIEDAALGIFLDHERLAIMRLVTAQVSDGLAALTATRPALQMAIAAIARDVSKPRILLSNGLFGPFGALIYALLRQADFTVIDFEHGVTTGLSAHSQAKIRFSEASTSDVIMVCANNAAHGFSFARNAQNVRREVIGLSEQTRRLLWPKIQRRLARRFLGLRADDSVVMHVSTWPYMGNMRPGCGPPTDTFVYATDRKLITHVYGRVPHTVLFKEYPTQRYPWQPSYSAIFTCASNVRIVPPEDLRYVRSAADIIVTATPTSTLGWLVGTDVPIVWLESRLINPLATEELRQAFLASFLCVDLDEADWAEQLSNILSHPLSEIRRKWEARADARRKLYSEAILGPSGGAGRRAAKIIDEIYRNRSNLKEVDFAEKKWSATI